MTLLKKTMKKKWRRVDVPAVSLQSASPPPDGEDFATSTIPGPSCQQRILCSDIVNISLFIRKICTSFDEDTDYIHTIVATSSIYSML
jgi:hypothetical protein